MSLSGCMRGRLWIAPRAWLAARVLPGTSNEFTLGGDPGDDGQGHSPGVALQRCAQFNAVLFVAGRGDLYVLLRPAGGGVTAYCRRASLGRFFICVGDGAQSDLGAGVAQSSAGRVSRFSG